MDDFDTTPFRLGASLETKRVFRAAEKAARKAMEMSTEEYLRQSRGDGHLKNGIDSEGVREIDPKPHSPARDNVVSPRLPQWSGDLHTQAAVRLIENPTDEQLEIYRNVAVEIYDETIGVDIFCHLFREATKSLPPHAFQLNPTQRQSLFMKIFKLCGEATGVCLKYFREHSTIEG